MGICGHWRHCRHLRHALPAGSCRRALRSLVYAGGAIHNPKTVPKPCPHSARHAHRSSGTGTSGGLRVPFGPFAAHPRLLSSYQHMHMQGPTPEGPSAGPAQETRVAGVIVQSFTHRYRADLNGSLETPPPVGTADYACSIGSDKVIIGPGCHGWMNWRQLVNTYNNLSPSFGSSPPLFVRS